MKYNTKNRMLKKKSVLRDHARAHNLSIDKFICYKQAKGILLIDIGLNKV
jgi:hypothetical protein